MKSVFANAPVLALLQMVFSQVQAQDFQYVVTNGTVTITSYLGMGGDVNIPSTINSLPVTSIGDFAFFLNKTLISVSIPDTVTNLGMDAFDGCTGLTRVTIPDSVTTVGEAAFGACGNLACVTIGNGITSIAANDFADCTNLTGVVMGNNVRSISQAAFIDCHSLTNLTFPNTLTNISWMAFQFCTSLTDIAIPKAVANLGLQAFCCCSALTNIALPDSLITIESFGFSGCTSLPNITIPKGVISLGYEVLEGCTNLVEITVDALNPAYSSLDGVLFNKDQTQLIRYPPAKSGNYWVPNSVTYIAPDAFDSCRGLTGFLASPRLPSPNGFGFSISWGTNRVAVVESSTNIAALTWLPVSTNTLVNGKAIFNDPGWTNYPVRFYRLRRL
jgi:hypothetical protein